MPTAIPAQLPLRTRPRGRRGGRPAGRQEITVPREVETDLDRRADELLGRSLILGSDSGIYSETALDRKMRDEAKRMPVLAEGGITEQMLECLIERRLEELIDAAGLSAMEEIVYRLHVAGFGVKRMAIALGIRRVTIDRRLKSIRRKVRAAYREGIYAGWYEVVL